MALLLVVQVDLVEVLVVSNHLILMISSVSSWEHLVLVVRKMTYCLVLVVEVSVEEAHERLELLEVGCRSLLV
jgi:hypothetical protein